MKGEAISALHISVYQEIPMPDGGRIIFADPIDEDWEDSELANHNVFRLGPKGNVIWQVRRDDENVIDWKSRDEYDRKHAPASKGYLDPFRNMSEDFIERKASNSSSISSPDPEEIHFSDFAPGRIVWLTTSRWQYDLDPNSGIARCTGKQVRW